MCTIFCKVDNIIANYLEQKALFAFAICVVANSKCLELNFIDVWSYGRQAGR